MRELDLAAFEAARQRALDQREALHCREVLARLHADRTGVAQQEIAVAREQALQVEADTRAFDDGTDLPDMFERRARHHVRQRARLEAEAVEYAERPVQHRDAVECGERAAHRHGFQAVRREIVERDAFVDRRVELVGFRCMGPLVVYRERGVVAEREHGFLAAEAEQLADVAFDVDPFSRPAFDVHAFGVGRQRAEVVRCRGRRVEAAEHAGVEQCGMRADRVRGRCVHRPLPQVRELRGGGFATLLRGQHDRIAVLDHERGRLVERVFVHAGRPAARQQRAVRQRVGVQHHHAGVLQHREMAAAGRLQFGHRGRRPRTERRRVLGMRAAPRDAFVEAAHAARRVAGFARLRRGHPARNAAAAFLARPYVVIEVAVSLAVAARYGCVGECVDEPADRACVVVRRRAPCVAFVLDRIGQPHVRGDVAAARELDLVAGLERIDLRARFGFERLAREAAAVAVVEIEHARHRLDCMPRFVRERVRDAARMPEAAVDRHAALARIDAAAAAALAERHAPAGVLKHAQLRRERA